jgi:hypothetical protein
MINAVSNTAAQIVTVMNSEKPSRLKALPRMARGPFSATSCQRKPAITMAPAAVAAVTRA